MLQTITPRFAVSKQRHGIPHQTGNSWRGGPVLTEPIILVKVVIKHKQRAGTKVLCIVSHDEYYRYEEFNGMRSSRISTQMVLDEIAAASHVEYVQPVIADFNIK